MSGAVDRPGCLWFCGIGRLVLEADSERKSTIRSWFPRSLGDDGPRWCSAKCRDLALPPINSSLPWDASVDARPSATASDSHARVYSAPAGGEEPALSAPVAGSASPVNVPLEPAVGQRWRGSINGTRLIGVEFDIVEPDGVDRFRIRVPSRPAYLDQLVVRIDWFNNRGYVYLGPTPTPPATNPPPPAASPSALPSRQLAGAGVRELVIAEPYRPWKPRHPVGIKCPRCLVTSEAGDQHLDTCVVMRERGPSASAAAPEAQRDTFADLVDEFDLLPEAGR